MTLTFVVKVTVYDCPEYVTMDDVVEQLSWGLNESPVGWDGTENYETLDAGIEVVS